VKQHRALSAPRVGRTVAALVLAMSATSFAFAQQARTAAAPAGDGKSPKASGAVAPSGAPTADDYVIGPDDVLAVVFWRDKDMSAEVAVRPDGKISLPVLNEVVASGLTAEQLRARITEAATKFVADPTVSVVVKAINSRKVFITGMVAKPGDYAIPGRTTVLQLIAMAGGLHEFADAKNISINRIENGRQLNLRFNYKDVSKGRNLKQNIELKPGDTIIVP
jgi:polysaccharide export outer membrane protein